LYAHAHANSNTNIHSHANADRHFHRDSHNHAKCNCCAHRNSDACAKGCAYAEAAPECATATVIETVEAGVRLHESR
jgi:hypothetical protein